MPLNRSRLTWYSYLLSGFFTFILNIQGNIIPFLRDELGLSYRAVSLHPSAIAAGMICTGFLTERVVSAIGRRGTYLVAVGGSIAGMLLICVAPNAAVSIAACGLVGITGAMIPGVMSGLLSFLHGGARDQAFAEAGAVTYACAITANFTAGAAVALGLGWRSAMLFGVACGIALVAVYGRDPIPDPPRRTVTTRQTLPAASWAYLVMLGLGVALEMCLLLWSPAFLQQVVGLSRSWAATASAAFPAAMLLGRWAGSVVVRRVPPPLLYPASLVLLMPGFALYWGVAAPVLAVTGLFVAGLAVSLLYPLAMSFAMGAAGPAGDAASARSGLAAGTAILLAPIALGTLADNLGLSSAQLIAPAFGVAILACFIVARALERRGAYVATASLS
jgi:predicted MFS family arabinose efflux permease